VGGSHKAAAEEVEACPTKHLALQHFEAVAMPLDGARTPRQGHTGLHRLVILGQPGGEALHGCYGTRGGALQPGIETLRLPLAALHPKEICGHVYSRIPLALMTPNSRFYKGKFEYRIKVTLGG
jgi:hypothetical protein